MFTGIIRHVGVIRRVRNQSSGKRVTVDLGPLAEGLAVGDSVAVGGVCLTVTEIRRQGVDFDVVAETLARSTLGALTAGSRVNLERSLRLTDGLDGHIVQGHVDGTAQVQAVRSGGEHIVDFTAERQLTEQMVAKGSACIDGVSLTLVNVSPGGFSVALVPTTLAETTLGELMAGSKVNVETDVIGKYVRKHLGSILPKGGSEITLEKMGEVGFL